MKNRIYGIVILLLLSACGGGDQSPDRTDTNGQQPEAVTWKSKFPSLWSVAYAADINPEDVTYEQFINTLAEKLKADATFTNSVKGDTGTQGIQGIAGPTGSQGTAGIDGIDGLDGTNATLPDWEAMYTFGAGDTFFYTCNANSLCTANDISFNQLTISATNTPYYLASSTAGNIVGTDLLNTGAAITNLHANQNCEYKAEVLAGGTDASRVLLPSKIEGGTITFHLKAAFTSEYDIQIGDASGGGPVPRISMTRRLPHSFSATQPEKDHVAYEFNNAGTHLGFKVILKRRCRLP